jgi:hypothetical protein
MSSWVVESDLLLGDGVSASEGAAQAPHKRRTCIAGMALVAIGSLCIVVWQQVLCKKSGTEATVDTITSLVGQKPGKEATVVLVNAKFGYQSEYALTSVTGQKQGIEEGLLSKCSVPCYVTYDFKHQQSADVVIQDMVSPFRPCSEQKPKHQKWAFSYYYEGFPRFFLALAQAQQQAPRIDWTITYNPQSDVHDPMLKMVPRSREHVDSTDYSKGRKHLLLWFVSNCNETSSTGRRDFAHRLMKYMPPDSVHIYGHCGTPSPCPGRNESDACYTKLFSKYKFYAAFENTGCEGYVTEKFWRPLIHGMVPLVFGGLARKDYSTRTGVPADAYLSVDDFSSMQELADRLKNMGDEEYNQFFAWRSKLQVISRTEVATSSLCDLCQAYRKPARRSRDVMQWFYNGTCRAYTDATSEWSFDKWNFYPSGDSWTPSSWKPVLYHANPSANFFQLKHNFHLP